MFIIFYPAFRRNAGIKLRNPKIEVLCAPRVSKKRGKSLGRSPVNRRPKPRDRLFQRLARRVTLPAFLRNAGVKVLPVIEDHGVKAKLRTPRVSKKHGAGGVLQTLIPRLFYNKRGKNLHIA